MSKKIKIGETIMKIAINKRNYKVHIADCYYVVNNADAYSVFYDIERAFIDQTIKKGHKLSICKKCIDNKAHRKQYANLITAINKFNKKDRSSK